MDNLYRVLFDYGDDEEIIKKWARDSDCAIILAQAQRIVGGKIYQWKRVDMWVEDQKFWTTVGHQ